MESFYFNWHKYYQTYTTIICAFVFLPPDLALEMQCLISQLVYVLLHTQVLFRKMRTRPYS